MKTPEEEEAIQQLRISYEKGRMDETTFKKMHERLVRGVFGRNLSEELATLGEVLPPLPVPMPSHIQ